MKKIFLAATLFSVFAMAKPLTGDVHVQVKGMVCAFCAQGIKKAFSQISEVESTTVSLEKKFVHLVIKKDKSLEDTKILEVIKEAGYEGTIGH